MHSPDKLQLFFDLRSRGNCLSYISRTIGVPTSTLGDWNRRYALDIDTSRACKWEAAEQAVKFNTEADLVRVIQRIDAFERELDRRNLERMSVGELVRVISLWRREYFRRRNGLLRSIERPTPFPESEISGKIPDLPGARPSPVAATLDSPVPNDSVTPDVRRGLTPHETKPEKIGIPESHFPTFSPAHLPTAQGEGNSNPSTTNHDPPPAHPHAPPLFSLEDHLPTPMDEWLPDHDDQLRVYRARQPSVADNPIPKKTNIASAA